MLEPTEPAALGRVEAVRTSRAFMREALAHAESGGGVPTIAGRPRRRPGRFGRRAPWTCLGAAYCLGMLRRLDIRAAYRSLSPGFWPTSVPFGKRTVVYGHNGSGKSTLAHLLLEVVSGNSPVEVTWDDCNHVHKIACGSGLSGRSMSVFTKEWVHRNLSQFLDGESALAIVTLGEEAIGAKEREKEPYRDVYDFCNRYSHGEGAEVVDVLDARAVHQQIRRCMEFLKYVDDEHFLRMCKAAHSDESLV